MKCLEEFHLLGGDGEVGPGLAKNLGVRVVRTTHTHAEGARERVVARDPLSALSRVLGWGGVDIDLDAVGARGELWVDGGGTRWLVFATLDLEAELSGTRVVGDRDLEITCEGGGLGSGLRAHGDAVDLAGTVVISGADLELFAEVDWVEVGLLDSGSKGLDSDEATGHVTDGAFSLGGEGAANLGAATDDAGVEDVVELRGTGVCVLRMCVQKGGGVWSSSQNSIQNPTTHPQPFTGNIHGNSPRC